MTEREKIIKIIRELEPIPNEAVWSYKIRVLKKLEEEKKKDSDFTNNK